MPVPVIWINGPFGVGKTTVARLLVARAPDHRFYDPEPLGIFMQRGAPRRWRRDDFQTWRLWQWSTALVLVARAWTSASPIVVPMTLVDREPRCRILGLLRRSRVAVHEVWLHADDWTVRQRLRDRGDAAGAWPERQLARCSAFAKRELVQRVDATRTPAEVSDAVLATVACR